MKIRILILTLLTFGFGCTAAAAAQQSDPAVPDRLKVTIDIQQTAKPASKYEYGMFIEHIGTLIYRSLWSEMLDDRKFYFPISSNEPEALPRPQGGRRAISFTNGVRSAPTKL